MLLISSVPALCRACVPVGKKRVLLYGLALVLVLTQDVDAQQGFHPEPLTIATACCGGDGCGVCAPMDVGQDPLCAWTAGADFLWIRPHFSEAVGFARGMQTPTSFETSDEELEFDYSGSWRARLGYGRADGSGDVSFTFWHLEGETTVSGGPVAPGEFIVDPFGNAVGTFVVIDPSDARFGTAVVGGDRIFARAAVDTNIYDVQFTRRIWTARSGWDVDWSVGARIGDIDQFYSSLITDTTGTLVSGGTYSAEFIGAGPSLGAAVRRRVGGSFSTFASGSMSLLVGQYDIAVRRDATPLFQARQTESLTRTVPVLQSEIGAAWRPARGVAVSVGWMFQAWLDLGTSGGQFDGVFAGSDDGNIMSFDGLTVRGEFLY